MQQTKREASRNLENVEPLRPVSSHPPKYDSEPMTIRLNSKAPGRQLVIDSRNQASQRLVNIVVASESGNPTLNHRA